MSLSVWESLFADGRFLRRTRGSSCVLRWALGCLTQGGGEQGRSSLMWVTCAHGKVTILGTPWLSCHGRSKERTLLQTSWKNQGQGSQIMLGNNQTDSKEAHSPKVAGTHEIITTLSKVLISHHPGQPPLFQKHAENPSSHLACEFLLLLFGLRS